MKWILAVTFLALNVFADPALSELPADVQKEINSTESATSAVAGERKKVSTASISGANDTQNSVHSSVSNSVQSTAQNEDAKLAVTETVNKATAKETEIPLSLEATKKVAAGETTYFRVLMIVALLGVLASGTWVFVRKAKSQNIKRNKNEIKVLAQHYLGPKKSLAVVRVAGESILVGVTDNQINMIKTLSLLDDELPEVTSANFKSELDMRIDQDTADTTSTRNTSLQASTYNRKSQINTKVATQADDEAEDFSIRGIKDLVSSKLKNMRSI